MASTMTENGEKRILASEGSHWYDRSGNPVYEVPKAKGDGMRPATLADARKLNLVPGYTTIENVAAKPGLQAWKLTQLLEAALTLPRLDGETLDEYAERIVEDSKAQSKEAADQGTQLHAAIEQAIRGEDYDDLFIPHVRNVTAVLKTLYGLDLIPAEAEKTFCSSYGFGGKIDWRQGNIIADFKSKQTIDDKKPLSFDNHGRQLAAYAVGAFGKYDGVRALNIFVGVDDEKVRIVEWTGEGLEKGWRQFLCLLDFWYLTTGLQRNDR
jgi:hypothetical protein